MLAESVRVLDHALQISAQATHEALQTLVTRGADFSDNDLKNAFASLQKLQQDYVAIASRLLIRTRAVNLTITNVPGPQFPLYCLGSKVLEAFPYVAYCIECQTIIERQRGNRSTTAYVR